MKVQELKNYGRSYAETMPNLPQSVDKLIKKVSSKVIRAHVGFLGSLRLLSRVGSLRR